MVGDDLRVLGQVVGEHVRRVPGHEPVAERAPVVGPAELADRDGGVGVGLLERVGALLVCGQLIVVPQPVVDLAGNLAGVNHHVLDRAATTGGAATACRQGQAQGGHA